MAKAKLYSVEQVDIATLQPHPRNYRAHPDDQVNHIIESIRTHGFYRNVVVAEDSTILAGHGVVIAAKKMGLKTVPIIRLKVAADDPRALKVLAGDNEIGHLGEVNDRALTDLLKDLQSAENGLLGTGYDDAMLAALVYITRPMSEIQGTDEAALWAGAGMPAYENSGTPCKLIVNFASEEARATFVDAFKFEIMKKEAKMWSMWYPPRQKDDVAAIQFTDQQ